MAADARLRELGIILPGAPRPLGFYVPCVRTGDLVFLSGMLPLKDGSLLSAGIVGRTVSIEEAQAACRQAVINALAVLKGALGSLDAVRRCVKVSGFIASAEGFFDQPAVLNAASELLVSIFGENGRHARAAVGVAVLPMNSPVEIDFVFEVGDQPM